MSKKIKLLSELQSLEYTKYLYTSQQHSAICDDFKILESYDIPNHNTSINLHCVYITIYSGDIFTPKYKHTPIMPYLYIGSTTLQNILLRNYHGSVSSKKYKSIWNQERINNPDLFKTYILAFVDTSNNARQLEGEFHIINDVKNNPKYLNMVHANEWYEWDGSDESLVTKKEFLRLAFMGEKNPMYGKRGKDNPNYGVPFTEERKRRISEGCKLVRGGAGNSSATEYHLTDTKGKLHIVIGTLEQFCMDNNISEKVIRKYMGKGVIPINEKRNATDKSRNTYGWSSVKIGKVNHKK